MAKFTEQNRVRRNALQIFFNETYAITSKSAMTAWGVIALDAGVRYGRNNKVCSAD